MRTHIFFALISFLSLNAVSQETGLGEPHNSKFKKYKEGKFPGTINGVLSVKKEDGTDLILDFQGGKACLEIVPDPEEVYDVSTKKFIGYSTSGKTKIEYEFYQAANSFSIQLPKEGYSAGVMDGAHDLVIMGLKYSYFQEKGMEYLSLYFEEDVILRGAKQKKITVRKGSSIVFAIQG